MARMVRRTLLVLLLALGLTACASTGFVTGTSGRPAGLYPGAGGSIAPESRKVSILLPLSGPLAPVGQSMLQAAEIVLEAPGSPQFKAFDTEGTPSGAAAAAQQAVAYGAGIILGPLTSADTGAAAPVARQASIPMLAFTNDQSQARPGVWVLGITPAQQVQRLVAALQSRGKTRLAALLPDSEFGAAMQEALQSAASAAGDPPPTIQMYSSGIGSINDAVRIVSDYADRRGPIQAQISAARALDNAAGRARMHELEREPIPPPPFDALLLAATGTDLQEIAAFLPYYDLDPGTVQVVGPILWQEPAARRGAGMGGAWYAAPDPASRQQFADAYAAKFGSPPPALADLAFDAAALARVLAQGPGYSVAALTNPSGFTGADGVMALRPDGEVARGLAVFAIGAGGEATVLDPAPTVLAGPGT
jgi:branched-chain amino acid transport system substrate-binding protein